MRLPLCEAVIAETMRLNSADRRFGASMVNIQRRVAREDIVCSGFRIPQGQAVIFATPPMIQAQGAFAAQDGTFDRRFDPHRFIRVRSPCDIPPGDKNCGQGRNHMFALC